MIPTVISKPDTADTSKLDFRNVQDQYAEVIATRYGITAARRVKEGDKTRPQLEARTTGAIAVAEPADQRTVG